MTPIDDEIFVCFDVESTGLDPNKDRIIEIAAIKFNLTQNFAQFHYLINPEIPIPLESQKIHHISDEMVQNQPTIASILPDFCKFLGDHPIIGHGISFDLAILQSSIQRANLSISLDKKIIIDTLRLARLYGESPSNSLDVLRQHFNIPFEGSHRALNDVVINIQVFKKLIKKFKTLSSLLQCLKKPILMKMMPLGKYKGRFFKEIPLEYLLWARRQKFDQDLHYSIQTEIHKRKSVENFSKATNPFHDLL